MKQRKRQNALGAKEYPLHKNLIYVVKRTAEHHPALLVWCAAMAVAQAALPVLTAYLPKVAIEKITNGASAGNLTIAVLAFMFGITVVAAFRMFSEKYLFSLRFSMNSYYLRKIANKGMTTDYVNQEKEAFRKLHNEAYGAIRGNNAPMLEVYAAGASLIANALGFAAFFSILLPLSPLIVLFLIATTLVSYIVGLRGIRWAAENDAEKAGYQQRLIYLNQVAGDIKPAKDIRLYGMRGWLGDIYGQNMRGLSGWYRRYAGKLFGVSVSDGALALAREGAAYAYLIYLVLKNRISVADFVLYFGAISAFSIWLSGLLTQVNALNRINISINYLRAFLEYPEPYLRSGGADPGAPADAPKPIELADVHFRYEGAETDALKDIRLRVEPGEHLAVVGLNGAGKTTLTKLICGLVDPTEGAVRYGGRDVRTLDRSAYYQLFSAVFQQFSLLPLSVEEIVAETVPESIDRDRAERCLKQAGLWEKIESLPSGMNSVLGKTIHDDGVEFSGGETQKLLLARALYREAPVMILDEPTAALDPVSESRLYETYNELTRGRTVVFISHRLASTRFCDRILLIENGAICEEGTHDVLLAKKGRYYRLFETQAKYYRENAAGEEAAL